MKNIFKSFTSKVLLDISNKKIPFSVDLKSLPMDDEKKNFLIERYSDFLFNPSDEDLELVIFLNKRERLEGDDVIFNKNLDEIDRGGTLEKMLAILAENLNTKLAFLSAFPEYINKYNLQDGITLILFKNRGEITRFEITRFDESFLISNIIKVYNENL